MATLIIAEKNKAAEAIAKAIGVVKVINKSKSLKIYSIPSKDIYVVPLRGHLLEYRNTDAYKSWIKPPPREIITNSNAIEKVPASYATPYIRALKEYSKISDHCIIGTDADIEGCNIGLFDALPYVKKLKPNVKISQMWLSSLQPKEIVNKFNNLITPKFSWGESGEARAIIDATIGFSATREVSNTLRPLLNKFGVRFTSIGRVQTSLLYLIYLKEKDIENFNPEPYFLIDAVLSHDIGTFKAHHVSNPFKKDSESKAREIFNKIQNEKITKVVDVSKNSKKRSPPTPLNTSKALILLTRNLRIPANIALKTMNALYLNKIISYPRTDSDVYKPNFNHKEILDKFTSHSQFGTYSLSLVKNKRILPTKGKKDAGDHPPITPLESIELNSTKFENKLQEKVYNLLARHYLALFGEDAIESTQILNILIKDEPFRAQRVSLISKGFLAIAPFLKPKYEEEIQISSNRIPVMEIIFNQKETQPPPRYTDTSLLKLMEKNHLGTKSTRPQIISILQQRQVIERVKYQYFITDLGKFIIESLIRIWLPFLKPDFTKMIEEKLEDIKEKREKMHNVVYAIRLEFLKLFDKFLAKKHELITKANNYKMNFTIPLTSSNCPFCNKIPMKFINLKSKRFLVCSDDHCKKYLSLPKKGKLRLLDSVCSICNFNIFKISLQKNKKSYNYYLCPKCWNDGFQDNLKQGNGFCSNCREFKISKDQCLKK
ncbi:MAG: DNA topoisomerase [Promethearchaeota archaeon]|jgi:DNA topoisomerase-1